MDNCFKATKIILSLLHVKHTSQYLKDNILSHPDHPSLLSISDTLEKYQIKTLAIKIDFEKLIEMPLPCIIQVNVKNEPLFFVLNSVSNNKVTYYNDTSKLIEISKEGFLDQWTGICLLLETTETTKEKDIEKKLKARRFQNLLKGSIAVMILSWIMLSFLKADISLSTSSIFYISIYSLLKGIGITVGVFLLWFDVDQYNPTLQNFCKGGGKKINCNAVLDSKHAKLFNGFLSLSLLSFSYFFGTLAYLLFTNFSPSGLAVLGVLSFLTLPIVGVSIYYQAVIIKQWCKFCIIIQVTLLMEIGIIFLSDFYKAPIAYETLPLLVTLLLLPILGWKFLKPLLKQRKEINFHKRALKKIKHNPNVLEGLLIKSRKINTQPERLGISFTNESAKYNIIKVCSPYCGPCAMAHPILEKLVIAGKINLQILFSVNSVEDKMGKPVGHFLALDQHNDKSHTQQALDNWYLAKKKDYDVFASKYPIKSELNAQMNKIKAMRQWCEAENITYTPTLFINGYELPKEYTIEDLSEVLQ